MSTKLKLLIEGQNAASAEVKQVTKDIVDLGNAADSTNAKLAGGSVAGAGKKNAAAAAAKETAKQLANVGQTATLANQAVSSLRYTAVVLGSSAFPQLTNAVLASSAAMQGLRAYATLSGASMVSVFTTAVPIVAAAGAEVAIVTKHWIALNNAIDQQRAAEKLLAQTGEDRKKRLLEEINLQEKLGNITAEQKNEILYGSKTAPRTNIYGNPIGGSLDLDAIQRRFEGVRKDAGTQPQTAFDTNQLKLQTELLDGHEREIALINQEYDAQRNLNAELVRQNKISGEQGAELNKLAEQSRDEQIARVQFAIAQEKTAKLKAIADETTAYSQAVRQRLQADMEAQRQVTGIQRQVGDNADNRIIGDPRSGPGAVADAQRRIEDRQYGDHLDYLDKLNLSDEQYWTAAQELAKDHSAKILEIERKKAQSEKQLNEQRLAATGEFLGNSAQLAKQFGREGFIAYKAFAIGQAVINTALAISNESSQGDIYSKVFRMAAIAALGAAQVAAIVAEAPPYTRGGVVPGQYNGQDDRTIQVGPGEVILNPRQAQMVGYDKIYGALEATGGKLPWNYTVPSPGKIMGFAGGGVVPATPAIGDLNVQVGLIENRQDEREWQAMKGRKVLMQNLHKWGARR